MIPRFGLRPFTLRIVACLCGIAAVAGCDENQNDQPSVGSNAAAGGAQVDRADNSGATNFDKNRIFEVLPVAKFAGQITVDGKPPAKVGKLFVILTDPNHLDEHARGTLPKLYAMCDADGRFAFGTYDLKNKNDGVVAGKYVVTFVLLHKFVPKNARAKGPSISERRGGYEKYSLPDDLKNLYSDPDRNAKSPAFLLNLQPPGMNDYQFDLGVAGKAPPPKPGSHAVTYMVIPK
jgi:hypothetical protein